MTNPDEQIRQMLSELMQIRGPIETREETLKRTSTEEFRAVHLATSAWYSTHMELVELHELAIEDYAASRNSVLALGLLHTGLVLAAQSIEKLLKCFLLAAGSTTSDTRRETHRITDLARKVHEQCGDDKILSYMRFSEDLEKWYNARYVDAHNRASGWSRSAIEKLDTLVLHLEEDMPMPPAVGHLKYGGGEMGHQWSSVFVRLFAVSFGQHRIALLMENPSLASRLEELEQAFLSRRLAAVLPAVTALENLEYNERTDAIMRKYQQPPQIG